MSSSEQVRGLTTKSESALNITYLELLRISSEAPHEDLLAFLSLIQSCKVEILPLVWYPALKVGRGGFAVLNGSPVHKEFSFVFKRSVDTKTKAGEGSKSLRSIMTELAILTHQNVKKHANVIDLYGVAWEVNPEEDRILPILVLERAPLGDLYRFRDTNRGNDMSAYTRLSLCYQIAEGLAMLHASLIIHGDIKPQNILIFESQEHKLIAKIADFGNSVAGDSEDSLYHLPQSDPWTAPEYHHRKLLVSAAKKMDIYSFAMLCVWLLLDERHGVVDADSSMRVFRAMKESNIQDQVTKVLSFLKLEKHHQEKLVRTFKMSLSEKPDDRIFSMQDLAESLNPNPNNLIICYQGSSLLQDTYHVEFNISYHFYPLTYSNYLVRKLIFQCFQQKAMTSSCSSCKSRALFELAFCYYIGFGIPRDHSLSLRFAQESGHDLEDIQDETEEVIDYVFYENEIVNSLRKKNFSMLMDHVNEYRKPEYNTEVVADTLAREIRDFEDVFQEQFLLTATLKGTLGSIYVGRGMLSEAEEVFKGLTRCFEKSEDHGMMHPDTLFCQRILAEVLRQNDKLQEAEELIQQVLKRSEKSDGQIDPHIIECKSTLGCIYFEKDRLEEAISIFLEVQQDAISLLGREHPQTLFAMTNLASAYRGRNMLKEAEELELAALGIKKRTLDDENQPHYSTVTSAANLAFTYFLQKRWDEAIELETWVLKQRIKSLGDYHASTVQAKESLEETKHHRDMELHQFGGSTEDALKPQPEESNCKKRKQFPV